MKTLRKLTVGLFGIAMIYTLGCETTNDPNVLDGNPNVEFTTVGSDFGVSLNAGNSFIEGINTDFKVISNQGGIITIRGTVVLDTFALRKIDTLAGTQGLPNAVKTELIEAYLERFGIALDSTSQEGYKLTMDIIGKVTSDGIQDFVFSKGNTSKPFTVVKYNAAIGDRYTFTTQEGVNIERKVTYRSTDDDYPIAFWRIKVIKVEQTSDDPLIEKLTFIANHKFGLVGIQANLANGKEALVDIMPPNL